MARLTQHTNAMPPKTAVSTPQAAQAVSPNVRNVVTPAIRPAHRRYPRWFFPVLSVTVFLTAGQLGHQVATGGLEYARKSAWKPGVQHTLKLPVPNLAWFAVAPQGNFYLVGYWTGNSARLELYKSSGELAWSQAHLLLDRPAFSQDGTEIFNGTEVLDAKTGKAIARISVAKPTYDIAWAAKGSRAVWKAGKNIQFWDRLSRSIHTIPLESPAQVSGELKVSPDGRWLATIYLDKYKANVALWDLDKPGKPQLFPVGHSGNESFGLEFSPDSQKLLYAGKESVMPLAQGRDWVSVWSLDGSKATFTFAPDQPVEKGVWSQDGKRIALRGAGEWGIYDVKTWERLWSTRYTTTSFMNEISFTQDNKLYYYDSFQEQWSLEYWDLGNALK
ncbi:MAG: WD40 repeat domain-containing protein [Armatimonas sp.]